MKKLFGHANDGYQEDDLQWDDLETEYSEDAAEEETYYSEEENSSEDYQEEGEYYPEEGEEGESYVEEGEYYPEEGNGEYYAEEEEYYPEEGENSQYSAGEEEYYAEDDECYVDNIEEYFLEEDEQEEIVSWEEPEEENIFRTLWLKLLHMETLDKVMMSTGILVLVLAVVTCFFFAGAKQIDRQVASFDTVGQQLVGIELIGEYGLHAVTEAEAARKEAADAITGNKNEGYDESEYSKEVVVTLNITSVEKDMKIKFVNDRTNKLVANVPFTVTAEAPGGEQYTWIDDDMDGIIYKDGMEAGKYKITMNALEDAKYADYILSTYTERVNVKKEITYEKIEVADEIKDESEVDVAKEDTKENDLEVESKLQDTVSWVESTKTVINSVYTAVPKTSVKDPLTLAKASAFMRTAQEGTLPGAEATPTATPTSEATPTPEVVVTPTPATPSPTPVVEITPTPEVTVTPTPAVEATPSPTPEVSESPSPEPTATPEAVVVTGIVLDKTQIALEKDKTAQLHATVEPAEITDVVLLWSSSDKTVATVDDTGKVTALKEGKTTITVLHEETGVKAECQVTVAEDSRTLTLSEEKLLLTKSIGAKDITATIGNSVTGGSIEGKVTAKIDNEAVATIVVGNTTDGAAKITITPKGLGTATVTVGVEDAPELTAKCTVTVADRTVTLSVATVSVLSGSSKDVEAVINGTGQSVEVESSNESVATATVKTSVSSGKTIAKVSIAGINAGTSTISIKYVEDGMELIKTCTVTVIDKNTKLLSKDNQQLYVMVSDSNYREATYADYYNTAIKTFYIKAESVVKYTGWQNVDGKVYYYDASGKYVTGEQVIQGAKYTFASDGSLVTGSGSFGIDVSKWNTVTDWNAVKNSGVNYVIIRCGYRGSTSGSLIVDPKFDEYIKGATSAGLKVGVYFFSQAVNNREAVEEASMVLELIEKYKISYPVYLDVEPSGGRADSISVATRTDVIKTFCQTIQNAGYTAGVYANKTWLNKKIDTAQLSKYKIWLAQYAAEPTYSGRYDMWQYSDKGKVSGIKGDVDLNISYLGY